MTGSGVDDGFDGGGGVVRSDATGSGVDDGFDGGDGVVRSDATGSGVDDGFDGGDGVVRSDVTGSGVDDGFDGEDGVVRSDATGSGVDDGFDGGGGVVRSDATGSGVDDGFDGGDGGQSVECFGASTTVAGGFDGGGGVFRFGEVFLCCPVITAAVHGHETVTKRTFSAKAAPCAVVFLRFGTTLNTKDKKVNEHSYLQKTHLPLPPNFGMYDLGDFFFFAGLLAFRIE